MKKLIAIITISTVMLAGCSSYASSDPSTARFPAYNVNYSEHSSVVGYGPGEYLIGTEIPAGSYRLYLLKGLESADFLVTNSRGGVTQSGTVTKSDEFYDITLKDGDTLEAFSFTIVPMSNIVLK